MADDGIEGVGELAGGGVGEGGVVEMVEDGEGAVEQFEMELGEALVELLVLLLGELGSEFVFVFDPVFEGAEGDFGLGGGLSAVAVELVEEVEGLDFLVEGVAGGHVGSFCVIGLGTG